MKPCASLCSRIHEQTNSIGTVTGLYKEKELMVEQRDCLNEQNQFSCKDYARVNGDSDPEKEKTVRQKVECSQNVCSGIK